MIFILIFTSIDHSIVISQIQYCIILSANIFIFKVNHAFKCKIILASSFVFILMILNSVYLKLFFQAEGYNINTTVVCPYFIRSTGMFEDVLSR